MSENSIPIDEVGYWSEIKLDILKSYAIEYSKILSAQTSPPLDHIYIDAFAGAGIHLSKLTGELIPGSPLNALNIEPHFKEYHFIDINKSRVNALQTISDERENVYIYESDCNKILQQEIFPRVLYEKYKRGLCLLDPYGLHLDWEIIETAGKMKSIEIFLNFPVADINRNVLRKNQDTVSEKQIARLDRFWGDHSWHDSAYQETQPDLFGDVFEEKTTNKKFAEAFRKRLKDVAGFKYVPQPMPMRNTKGAIVYYLFFASQKPVAKNIVSHIFKKYENRGI